MTFIANRVDRVNRPSTGAPQRLVILTAEGRTEIPFLRSADLSEDGYALLHNYLDQGFSVSFDAAGDAILTAPRNGEGRR